MNRPEEQTIRDAIEALAEAERLVLSVNRPETVTRLSELLEFVESLSRLQVDLRLAKIRLQALLDPNDPDKTPVHGVSTDRLRAALDAGRPRK